MNIIGFDGKLHKFNYIKNKSRKHRSGKSSYHLLAREILLKVYPSYQFYEEVTLPGSKKPARKNLLYADFFIPEIMTIIEVHGEQHYKFCPIFHKDKMAFFKGLVRDKDKKEWCEINNIKYIELKYNEKDIWESIISSKS